MGELVAGALLEQAVSELTNGILLVLNKTWYFKSKLKEMQETLKIIKPIFDDMEKLNKELDRWKEETDKWVSLLNKAEQLVKKCEEIKWDPWKRYRHAFKLDGMNASLVKFVQFDLQLLMARNGVETYVAVKGLEKGLEEGNSSGAPPPKCVAVGFGDRLRELKAMVLKDSPDNDCSVVVVSAAGGCGKTTLVRELCHDPEIKETFGGNIYYAVIPEKYNIKVIVEKLLRRRRNKQDDFESDEEAIQQWGSFLGSKSQILLVLDDVRSESIIMEFKFKSPGYKILVTSREAYTQFNLYQLPVLNDHDSTSLFRRSAFSEDSNINIPDDLVDKLVECCKNHPLALSVIGGSLKGKPLPTWISTLNTLSKGKFSNLHKSIQDCLEKGSYLFNDKPEYLDLGLFPEDQKIAATALLDMWAHLYDHDDNGSDTMNTVTTLSSRNLATWSPKRKNLPAIAHHCEEEFVTQHDMMRELALHLSSQESTEVRERLIINTDGLQNLPQTVNARILSIFADESFPVTRDEIKAPKVEVFVLNFMNNMHPLPQFMQNMVSLKVLIITNYGYYFPEIQNFPAPKHLSGLTRIRLDHVSISSISTTLLELENLQKLSMIMCKIGNSFNKGIPNKLTRLLEIDIESCDDLVTFPVMLCSVVGLKKLSITNCHELTSLSEEFGKLLKLEILRLASCSKLAALPESIRNLKNLKNMDLSHCLSLHKLPLHIGELGSLQTIYVTGCTGLCQHELPKSVEDFKKVKVFSDEETSHLWDDFKNVEVKVVKEDTLDTFMKIIPKGYI